MATSTRVERWRPRKRGTMKNKYWSGLEGDRANGWCIFTHDRVGGFYLKETGGKRVVNGVLKDAKKFGPFPSFEAAKAAFTIMHDME